MPVRYVVHHRWCGDDLDTGGVRELPSMRRLRQEIRRVARFRPDMELSPDCLALRLEDREEIRWEIVK
jgi:hypothetical protein